MNIFVSDFLRPFITLPKKSGTMKHYLILFLMLLNGAPVYYAMGANNFQWDAHWDKLTCEVVKEHTKGRPRSVCYVPQVYLSEQYFSLQSETMNYSNVLVSIFNLQGEIVKEDIMQVVAGAENLFYIGDLEAGIYCVNIVFDEFTLKGSFEKY